MNLDHAVIAYAMKSNGPDEGFTGIVVQNRNTQRQPTVLIATLRRKGFKVFAASTLLSFDDFKKRHHQFQNQATPNHAKPLIDGTVHGVTFDTGSSET